MLEKGVVLDVFVRICLYFNVNYLGRQNMIPAVNGVRFRFDTHIFCFNTSAGFEKMLINGLFFFVFEKE